MRGLYHNCQGNTAGCGGEETSLGRAGQAHGAGGCRADLPSGPMGGLAAPSLPVPRGAGRHSAREAHRAHTRCASPGWWPNAKFQHVGSHSVPEAPRLGPLRHVKGTRGRGVGDTREGAAPARQVWPGAGNRIRPQENLGNHQGQPASPPIALASDLPAPGKRSSKVLGTLEGPIQKRDVRARWWPPPPQPCHPRHSEDQGSQGAASARRAWSSGGSSTTSSPAPRVTGLRSSPFPWVAPAHASGPSVGTSRPPTGSSCPAPRARRLPCGDAGTMQHRRRPGKSTLTVWTLGGGGRLHLAALLPAPRGPPPPAAPPHLCQVTFSLQTHPAGLGPIPMTSFYPHSTCKDLFPIKLRPRMGQLQWRHTL